MVKIAAFTDGRPGHEKQTRAVVDAVAAQQKTEIEWIHVKHHSLMQDVLLTFLLFIPCFKPFRGSCPEADIFIGTGRRTHLPLLLARRGCDGFAVCCMYPSFFFRSFFDLCLVPRHDGVAEKDNIFLTTGPPATSHVSNVRNQHKGLILVGGIDKKSHYWDTNEICENIDLLLGREKKKRWTISTSPRTPQESYAPLEALADKHKNCVFIRFEDTARGWVEEQYAVSGTVWVTADSMSMVFEALSAGCEVGLLPVRWKKRNRKFIRCERQLIEENVVLAFDEKVTGSEKKVYNTVEQLNEAQRCANEIIKRWKIKN